MPIPLKTKNAFDFGLHEIVKSEEMKKQELEDF